MKLPHLFAFLLSCFLAAFALAGPRKPKVIIVHSDSAANAKDVQNKLLATGLFAQADLFSAEFATPSLAQLSAYDAALVWNFNAWHDRAALGTALAQYVDAGFGVVQTIFTAAGVNGSNLGGSWTSSYNCISFTNAITGSAATLGTVALPDHAIMNGVSVFNGGNTSARPNGTALQAGASLVASWSDGKPLVAVGPKINRADLGFYPASSDASISGWVANTDGVKLLANALTYVIRPKVLICASAAPSIVDSRFTDPQAKLRATGRFSAVDIFNAAAGTPTLDVLQNYDAVLTWSNSAYSNSISLGNLLADYVDAGYGVVVAPFANSNNGSALQGRWLSGTYRIILSSATATTGHQTFGFSEYPSHPILANMSTFDGGSMSFRSANTSLPSHGIRIAEWSDGKILAAASTARANRADIGFYPPSSDAGSGFWDASTDGDRIMADALLYTIRPYIALAHSQGSNSIPSKMAQRLMKLRRFSGVHVLTSLDTLTPTSVTLRPFNSVLLWSAENFADAVTFGNRLASYMENGGSVVEAVFCNTANVGYAFSRPNGAWISKGYDITPEGSTGASMSGAATLGTFVGPAHPVQTFVRKFAGGASSVRQGNNPLLRGRRLLNWSDGKMLASIHNFYRRVDLGFSPISNADLADSWNAGTDGNTLIANALTFAAAMTPCRGDFNGDSQIDDADFSLFLNYYDNLIDPRGDLTGDGLTEDADFSIFVQGYDALLCP